MNSRKYEKPNIKAMWTILLLTKASRAAFSNMIIHKSQVTPTFDLAYH